MQRVRPAARDVLFRSPEYRRKKERKKKHGEERSVKGPCVELFEQGLRVAEGGLRDDLHDLDVLLAVGVGELQDGIEADVDNAQHAGTAYFTTGVVSPLKDSLRG